MRVFLLFLCYSFLGWACETVYCSIGKRKFVNRGFLNGPLCPVYGFGALAVLYFLRPVSDNIPLLFVSGMVLTSVIEYITGYLLEKLFATKWWDYSSRRFNIHGRVCLRNSLMFGALSVVAVRVIDPVIRGGIYALPATVCAVLSIVFGAMMVADLVVTVRTILDINSALKQLQQMVEQARLDTQEYLRQNQEELQQKMAQGKGADRGAPAPEPAGAAAEDGAEPPGPRACPHGAARLFGTAALGAPGAQGAAAQGVFVPPYPRAAAGHPEAGGAYGSSFQTQRHSAPQAAQSLPGDALHPLRAGAGADARGAAQKEKIKWIFPFLPARGGIFLHGTANPVAFLWRIVYNGSTNSVKFSRKQGKLFLEFLKWVQ